ncbi:hypothetical protein C8034_v003476 [Colletotrichum sidae]|uniref:Uncharacterized protein n=1 Tax=Colletotrichum sidae TaxID=1347389 RepID=A0A4R8TB11_9PEZI|nr:hypothetical protein C8034_v003476 [Colletotrichum sidae]
MSNIVDAPHVVVRAREKYCLALKETNKALRHPIQVKADSTLTAVLLLGLFETIAFDGWKNYHIWATHIQGATALLQLRGTHQFTHEIQACIQQGIRVPSALTEVNSNFERNGVVGPYNSIQPVSLAFIGFRIVDLCADIKSHLLTDSRTICHFALDIKANLKAWADLRSETFFEISTVREAANICFEDKKHVYSSVWGAQLWNSWRSLGILINQIILDSLDHLLLHNQEIKRDVYSEALYSLRNLSQDICISTPNLASSPRAPTMIWPLYMVLQEARNVETVRSWAAIQLQGIKTYMGIKQAAVLAADTWRESLTPHFNIFA